MKPHEKILKMIEEVDPNDTATLDEIDARVFCYLHKHNFAGLWNNIVYIRDTETQCELNAGILGIRYTRSRDALKAIRPSGWLPLGCGNNSYGYSAIGCVSGGFVFSIYKPDPYNQNGFFKSPYLPTEELSELHAIIQAIAHERGE